MDAEKQDENISVQITKDFKDTDADPAKLEKLVKAICNRFNLANATVSITIVGNAEIRKLNDKFLNRNCPTDCLSFDLSDNDISSQSARVLELIVNAELAVKEASLRGHSGEAELALYITHGLLHNLGFDDSEKIQAEKMHEMEDEILQQFGFGMIYNKRSIPQ